MPNQTIVAIIAIAAVLITCICKNIDGAVVGAGVAAIAGLGGYAIGKFKRK
ncbi:unnamed protein product [marine sediment metagenome]|uniref:Uncharacterized protein n=1 Tax=marine sediment metagenome TaxID=412755 RepID=X1SXD8_9ZZZZ